MIWNAQIWYFNNPPFVHIVKASFEVLCPDYVDAVYDLTIAYSNDYEDITPRKQAPNMTGKWSPLPIILPISDA